MFVYGFVAWSHCLVEKILVVVLTGICVVVCEVNILIVKQPVWCSDAWHKWPSHCKSFS